MKDTFFVVTKSGVVDLLAEPGEGEPFTIFVYAPVRPATAGQRSWLLGNGFRELAVMSTDLQAILSRGKGQ
jgi:hypothetical protein